MVLGFFYNYILVIVVNLRAFNLNLNSLSHIMTIPIYIDEIEVIFTSHVPFSFICTYLVEESGRISLSEY